MFKIFFAHLGPNYSNPGSRPGHKNGCSLLENHGIDLIFLVKGLERRPQILKHFPLFSSEPTRSNSLLNILGTFFLHRRKYFSDIQVPDKNVRFEETYHVCIENEAFLIRII